MAEIKGWSVEEAVVRHRAADAVGALAVELASAWPDVFVGSVLNESPLGPPAVYIKGEVPQAIEALVARAGTQIAIVDGQPFSAVELEERSRVVHEHLVAAGFEEVSTGYRIEDRGEIRAAVRQAGGRTVDDGDVLAALPTDLRGSVRLEAADSPTVVDEHAYGGMSVRDDGVAECTSGWAVLNPAATTGVTTAGHCDGINEIVDPGAGVWGLAHQVEHRGQWSDVEWKTSAHSEPAQFWATATEIRRTNFLEPRAAISQGESVCLYGRASNSRQCRDVENTSWSCTNDGFTNDRLVRMNDDVSTGGDSGAPWSFATTAYGSHKGICSDNSVFSVADLYDEALGIRVRLSDVLDQGVLLHDADSLVSTDGRFTAVMQNDGNFVLYQSGVGPIWASGTDGNPGAFIVMQGDGNLVIYRSNNTAAWATATFGSGHMLRMQNDGNLVMYRPGFGAVWATGTCCR